MKWNNIRFFCFYMFLVLFLWNAKQTKLYAQVNESDSLALVELYNATDGPNWTYDNTTYYDYSLDGWQNIPNAGNIWLVGDVATWHGIEVDESGQNVAKVILYSNDLSNNIPDLNLPILTDLYLSSNQLSGSIPDFSNLNNLTDLNLRSNQLSGSIPDFSNLNNLTDLVLYSNQLSGSIPDFTNLNNLTTLDLYSNELSGSIPDFTNLNNLTTLDLYSNELSGSIPDFSNLNNLTDLVLYSNQLSGSIPDFTNLNNLTTLDLRNNQLSGSIPDFTNLNNLTDLELSSNQLIGSIPDFTNLNNLTHLELAHNQLSGGIPDFSNLPSLMNLSFYNNQLSGDIPDFSNLPNLTDLNLGVNYLNGTLPDFNLPSLTDLNLSFNDLSGSIPDFNLPNLSYLNLTSNQLSGSIPDFSNLPSLIALYLSFNELSGSIPDFSNLPSLSLLYLGDNLLSGNIPDFTNLLSVSYLNLRDNQLTFRGLEQNVNNLNLSCYSFLEPCLRYAPQSTIPISQNGNTLSVSAGGTLSNNHYTWYKDGSLFQTIDADSTFTVTESGTYHCEVSNDIVTNPDIEEQNLVLVSESIDVLVENQVSCLSESDSLQLVDFYNATGGDNWNNNGWLTAPVNEWYGITLTEDGCAVAEIYLWGNQLSGELIDLNLPSLTDLNLGVNELSGSIPDFANLNNLTNLSLSYNELSGSIPDFANLPNLTDLNLGVNQLSGSIPDFSNLNNLTYLSLRYNQLSGSIPDFSNLNNLTSLYLNNNQLTFNGLEENVNNNFSLFYYAPQATIPISQNGNTLSISAGGTLSNNHYTWFLNGDSLTTINADSTFTVTQNGTYHCEVSNDIVTNPDIEEQNLVLVSESILMEVVDCSSFVATVSENQTICEGDNAIFTASGGTSYLWSNDDTTASINVTPLETTVYEVTVTDENTCTASAGVIATVEYCPPTDCAEAGDLIVVNGVVEGVEYCSTTGIQLATEGANEDAATIFMLTYPSNGNALASNTSGYFPLIPGANYLAWAINTCGFIQNIPNNEADILAAAAAGSLDFDTLTLSLNSYLNIYTNTICNDTVGGYFIEATISGGFPSNDGFGTYTVNYPVVSGSLTGTPPLTVTLSNEDGLPFPVGETVNLEVINDGGGCQTIKNIDVIEESCNIECPATITFNSTNICLGDSITLSANNGISYLWNTGATTSEITVSPTTNMVYGVTVTQSNDCWAAAQKTITVSDISANLGEDMVRCGSQNLLLQADYSPNNVFVMWSTGQFGDEIEILATETATYEVTVSDVFGCSATDEIVVEILDLNEEACNGCLANAGTITDTLVYLCDSEAISLTAINYNTDFLQTYLLVENNVIIDINETNGFGDLNSGTYQIYAANYENENAFAVGDNINTLIANELDENNCYEISEATTISMSPAIQIAHQIRCSEEVTDNNEPTYYIEVCISGGLPALEDEGFYIVNSNDTIPYTETCIYTTLKDSDGNWLTIPTSSNYSIQVTDETAICEATATGITFPENFITLQDTSICPEASVELSVLDIGTTYEWNTTPPQITPNITVSPLETTTYSITITDEYGCQTTDTTTVIVRQLPENTVFNIFFNETETACDIQLAFDQNGSITYNSETISFVANEENTITVPTNTNVGTLIFEPSDTTVYCPLEIEINTVICEPDCPTPPSLTANELDFEVCLGEQNPVFQISINALVTDYEIQWFQNGNFIPNTNQTTYQSFDTNIGTYNYSVLAVYTGNQACENSNAINFSLQINDLPNAEITTNIANNMICAGDSIRLTASGGISYEWDTAENTTEITVSPLETTIYAVNTINENNCFATANIEIIVNDCNFCQTLPDTISLDFAHKMSLIFADINSTLAEANYQVQIDTLLTNFEKNENLIITNDSIIYNNNIPYYNYANTDVLHYSILNQNNFVCSDSMIIDILCPEIELENTNYDGICTNDTATLRFRAEFAATSEALLVNYQIKNSNDSVIQGDLASNLSEISLPNGFYTLEVQPVGMNCPAIEQEFELQGELTASFDTLTYINPYNCVAYINISGCFDPFNELADSIPYDVICNNRPILRDSCRWIENILPNGFTERYYQCSIDLLEGENEANLAITSNSVEETLYYTIPKFHCSENFCEKMMAMPNPNDGHFDLKLLDVPKDAAIDIHLYDLTGRLLLIVEKKYDGIQNILATSTCDNIDIVSYNKNVFTFDISSFPNGMYFATVSIDGVNRCRESTKYKKGNKSRQSAIKIIKIRNKQF